MNAPTPIVELNAVSFSYPDNGASGDKVLSAVDLSLNPGEIVCIVGPSGCGKTTLLNLVAGLERPNAGSVRYPLQNTGSKPRFGYIFQQDALLPWRTVRSNIRLGAELSLDLAEDELESRTLTHLKTFHLDPSILELHPGQLSGGMRQRVSIIQALIYNPDIILLDEPFSALDFYTKLHLEGEFWELINEQGKAALFVTHDIEEAIALGDRVVVMHPNPGRIVKQVTVDLDGPQHPENVRSHAEFGAYFDELWLSLKDGVSDKGTN